MGVSVKKGTFAAATSTGNQAVTGVGFQGKAVLLWGVTATATGFQAGGGWFFGAATGTANRWARAGFSADAAAGGDSYRENATAACIHTLADAAGGADAVADFVSFDSDGFTINWSNAPASAWIVHYLVIGGTDVEAKAILADQPAAVGNQAVTGVGFPPKALLACHVFAGSSGAHNGMGLGFATSTTVNESVSMYHRDRDAVATTEHASVQLTDRCIVGVSSTAATILSDAKVASWNADGVTMNWVATPGVAASGIGYLFLGGTAKYMAGADEQRTSTGTKQTRVGMAPAGVIVGSATAVASAAVDSGTTQWTVGASDGTNHGHIWHVSEDGLATSSVDVRTNTTSLMGMATQPSTVDADGAISDMTYPGFTINWTTADSVARQFIYLAIGLDSPSVAPIGNAPLASAWLQDTSQFVKQSPGAAGPATWTNWLFGVASGSTFFQTISAAATGTASLILRAGKTLAATSTATASLVKRPAKILSATATGTASLVKLPATSISAAAVGTASLVKQARKILSATGTGSATLAGAKVVLTTLSAAATGTASLSRSVGKIMTVTAAGTATRVLRAAKTLSVGATGTASLAALKTLFITISAGATGTASMLKRPGKVVSATATGTGSFVRSVGKLMSVTATGAATRVLRAAHTISAGATGTATLTPLKAIFLTISATATGTASLVKRPAKILSVTATGAASLVTAAFKSVVMSVTATGGASLVRQAGKQLSAAATGTSLFVRQVQIVRSVLAVGNTVLSVLANVLPGGGRPEYLNNYRPITFRVRRRRR